MPGSRAGWHGMDRGRSDLSDHRCPPAPPQHSGLWSRGCVAPEGNGVHRLRVASSWPLSAGCGCPGASRTALSPAGVATGNSPGPSMLAGCLSPSSPLSPPCPPRDPWSPPTSTASAAGSSRPWPACPTDSLLPPGTWGPLQPIQALGGGALGSDRAHWTRHHAAEVPLRVGGTAWEVIPFQSPKCEPEQKPSCLPLSF